MKKEIAIIVAKSINNVIGSNGDIPWYLPPDLKHFKEITTGYPIVMGKNTFYSIPKVLPNRLNVVVSRDTNIERKDVLRIENISDILYLDTPKIFYIGGHGIYKEAMNICNKLYVTQLLHEYQGDTYFPEIDMTKWKIQYSSAKQDYKGIYYVFQEYVLR